jgi:hypothetical protein
MTTSAEPVKKSKFRLGSLFFEEDAPTVVQTAQPTVTTQAPYGIPAVATVDPKIKESLTAALEENSLGSYDYLKFRKSSDAMKNVVADEISRFRAAFIAAQTLGVTKEKLIETANHYLKVLAEEERKFNDMVDSNNKSKIVAGEQTIKNLEDSIQSKALTIKNLSEEIAVLQKDKATAQTKLVEDKSRIEATTAGFTTTLNTFVQDIKTDISKIQANL